MAIYLYIWILIIIKTLSFSKNKKNLFVFYIFLSFFIGLRQEIGGDWFNYLNMYNKIIKLQFKEALFVTDPLYGTLNWVSGVFKLGGIYFVNFICAFIFCSSIYFFSKNFKNIWFPVIILYPYTILAVSMGYTRQSVAIAFVVFAFNSLFNNKKIYFLLFILLGMLFHKSAAILLMLLPFIYSRELNLKLFFLVYYIILTIILLFFFYLILLQNNIYLSGAIHSSGSTVRVLIHILPLTIYLIYRELFRKKQIIPIRILDVMAIMIILSLILSVFFSTLADRFSLYLIIFDIIILSVFLDSLKTNQRLFFISMLIMINSIVLYSWLFYSPWAQCCWVPYNNLIMAIL
ncbi:EpsG family protein [Xenorhabdus sp. SGI246]|uniref:EpsG family protein n=1 Tax=Xenorhabdus sp. SGI246 TaxID=3158263 RepID=UPI00349F33C8